MISDMERNDKIGNAMDFIEYISKDMEKEDLLLLYRINNIKRERLEMFSDFIYSLNELIITTYLGDDITLGKNKIKHFKWCWNEVICSFKKEGVYFLETEELYNYFLTFYQESFYEEEKEINKTLTIGPFWEELLRHGETKTMSEYETLLEVYKIFNKSFVVN
tara:strand:- start:8200 stop:8688 length:489 start_codon:yes stop_codon:yes gene_type:complete